MAEDIYGQTFPVDDPGAVATIGGLVHDWEPSLDLFRPPADSLFYEPDGTTYAVALSPGMRVNYGPTRRVVGAGDVLVIPRALALDIGPRIDVVAVRHDGPPPDHFRERFIQVWGFEHLTAPDAAESATAGSVDVIPASETCFRMLYAVVDVNFAYSFDLPPARSLRILIALCGELTVSPAGTEILFPSRHAVVVAVGRSSRLGGRGRVGVVTLEHELAFEARRRAGTVAGSCTPSPERVPPYTKA